MNWTRPLWAALFLVLAILSAIVIWVLAGIVLTGVQIH